MSDALLLLPDFALIAVGALVCRFTKLGRSVWDGIEQLVYQLLFPALLFTTILHSNITLGSALPLAAAGLVLTGVAIALSLAIGAVPGVDRRLHASGAQTAFRFNTYVALALVSRLAGPSSVAYMAVLIAVCVPVVNVAAVWPLARHGGQGLWRELARNPLILATVGGLVCKALGLSLPSLLDITLSRMGSAALPLGLMAVGAGLQPGALGLAPRLAAAFMTIRHLVMPATALAFALLSSLPTTQQAVLMAYAAAPTASSAYVLAVRMGGHGGYTAGLITLSTLLATLTLPLWLALWRSLAGA